MAVGQQEDRHEATQMESRTEGANRMRAVGFAAILLMRPMLDAFARLGRVRGLVSQPPKPATIASSSLLRSFR